MTFLIQRSVTGDVVTLMLSGDIAAGDPPPGKAGWTIKVEPDGREVLLNNAAISTSGAASM